MSTLPKGWTKTSVIEIGDNDDVPILTGPFGSNLGRKDFRPTGVPVFTIGCLGDDGIQRSKLLFISGDKADELITYSLRAGDFLFSRMASVGRVGFVPDDLDGGIFNYHIMRLRLDQRTVEPRYFFHFVRGAPAVKTYLEEVNRGATRDGINTKLLSRMPVLLAPREEQRRIVIKLDSLIARTSRARHELDRIPKLVERYKAAILSKAFSSEGTTMTPLGELIGEGPTNGYSPRASSDGNGTLSLKLTATTRGVLDLSEKAIKRIGETIPATSRLWLEPGDLLIQRANSLEYVGASAIYDGPRFTYVYPDLMMRIRVSCPHLRRFIWRYLNCPEARSYFMAKATGTAGNMPKINGEIVRSLPVPMPEQTEIPKINSVIDTAFAWLDKVATEHARAAHLLPKLDQAILAKAFRGELVPQEPDDEPASVLLERIRAERGGAPPQRRRQRRSQASS